MKSHRMIEALAKYLGVEVKDYSSLGMTDVSIKRYHDTPARMRDLARVDAKVDLLIEHLGLELVEQPSQRMQKRSKA